MAEQWVGDPRTWLSLAPLAALQLNEELRDRMEYLYARSDHGFSQIGAVNVDTSVASVEFDDSQIDDAKLLLLVWTSVRASTLTSSIANLEMTVGGQTSGYYRDYWRPGYTPIIGRNLASARLAFVPADTANDVVPDDYGGAGFAFLFNPGHTSRRGQYVAFGITAYDDPAGTSTNPIDLTVCSGYLGAHSLGTPVEIKAAYSSDAPMIEDGSHFSLYGIAS